MELSSELEDGLRIPASTFLSSSSHQGGGRSSHPYPQVGFHSCLRSDQEGTWLRTFLVQSKAMESEEPTGFQGGFATPWKYGLEEVVKGFCPTGGSSWAPFRELFALSSCLEWARECIWGACSVGLWFHWSLCSCFPTAQIVLPPPILRQQMWRQSHFLCDSFLDPSLLPPGVRISFFFLCF